MNDLLLFFHSLIRYAVIITVAFAGITHLIALLRKAPILNGERQAAIFAVVFSHVQLVLGLVLYFLRKDAYVSSTTTGRFWKFEHIGMMVIAVALVTIGRSLSKRGKEDQIKQRRVAIFYLIALVLMLWATPWPFTELGHGRGWL